MSELLMLARERFFPDYELLDQCFGKLPRHRRPRYKVYCGSNREFLLAMQVAPDNADISFLFPDDLEHESRKFDKYHRNFFAMKEYLLNNFKGKYVAISEGKVIASGEKERELRQAVYKNKGPVFIMIRKVEERSFEEEKYP